MTHNHDVARGKAIADSGKYLPPQGNFLGRIQPWGLDVYQGSPQQWIDALFNEQERRHRDGAQ